jgi:pyruvate,water dikinase
VRPEDPFEFTELLGSGGLEGFERNRRLAEMAAFVREKGERDPNFARLVEAFLVDFGDTAGAFSLRREDLLMLVARMAEVTVARAGAVPRGSGEKTEAFLRRFAGEGRKRAEELLELGRASYRMRDNDNLHLARVESQLVRAVEEGKKRLAGLGLKTALLGSEQVAAGLRDPSKAPDPTPVETAVAEPVELKDNPRAVPETVREREGGFKLSARQLTGQPAGRGIAAGKARVVLGGADLLAFIPGEILVCDAIDPSMTFVVPLAAGVVERRGGMLIHGAIIAREYGLPCVTGVPNATSLIKTGDSLVVDGYLGIVTLAEDGGGSRGAGR